MTVDALDKLRPLRRKLDRLGTYEDMRGMLPPMLREKVNERMIWAVNELSEDGKSSRDTKVFLEDRAKRLIRDMTRLSFTIAARRFRQAITARKQVEEKQQKCRGKRGSGP